MEDGQRGDDIAFSFQSQKVQDSLDGRTVNLTDAGAVEELLRVGGKLHLGEGVLVASGDASLASVQALHR